MLLTQKRPFNRVKGTIVTPLVTAVKPCQQMRQAVPPSKLSSTQLSAERQAKTSIASPRSSSEVAGKASTMQVGSKLLINESTLSKEVARKASLAKTSILAKDSVRSDLADLEVSMSDMKIPIGPPSPASSFIESHRKLQESSRLLQDAIDANVKKNIKDI